MSEPKIYYGGGDDCYKLYEGSDPAREFNTDLSDWIKLVEHSAYLALQARLEKAEQLLKWYAGIEGFDKAKDYFREEHGTDSNT